MAFTNTWDDTTPSDAQPASQGAQDFRSLKLDIQQRMSAISGVSTALPNFLTDAQPVNWTGLLCFATDNGHVYRWNGGGWEDVTGQILTGNVPSLVFETDLLGLTANQNISMVASTPAAGMYVLYATSAVLVGAGSSGLTGDVAFTWNTNNLNVELFSGTAGVPYGFFYGIQTFWSDMSKPIAFTTTWLPGTGSHYELHLRLYQLN